MDRGTRSRNSTVKTSVQAAFETAPRVWVLCVKFLFLSPDQPFPHPPRFMSILPRRTQEKALPTNEAHRILCFCSPEHLYLRSAPKVFAFERVHAKKEIFNP